MKLCYQVATPDVSLSESVTAYQGSLQQTFGDISSLGYDGVELMTLDPGKLNWNEIKDLAKDLNLYIALICTGEIYGQLGLSFSDPDAGIRREAIEKVKEIIDFASFFGAMVNIGRIRGQYKPGIAHRQTEEWVVNAFKVISDIK